MLKLAAVAAPSVVLALSALAQAQSLNKCIDATGKVVYQSAPCDGAARQATVKTDRAPENRGQKPALSAGEKRLLRDAELRDAESERRVLAGMDRDAVIRIHGQPKTVNLSRRNDGATEEQMVYRVRVPCRGYTDEYTMYVYLRDNIVTSKSEHVSCSR